MVDMSVSDDGTAAMFKVGHEHFLFSGQITPVDALRALETGDLFYQTIKATNVLRYFIAKQPTSGGSFAERHAAKHAARPVLHALHALFN